MRKNELSRPKITDRSIEDQKALRKYWGLPNIDSPKTRNCCVCDRQFVSSEGRRRCRHCSDGGADLLTSPPASISMTRRNRILEG